MYRFIILENRENENKVVLYDANTQGMCVCKVGTVKTLMNEGYSVLGAVIGADGMLEITPHTESGAVAKRHTHYNVTNAQRIESLREQGIKPNAESVVATQTGNQKKGRPSKKVTQTAVKPTSSIKAQNRSKRGGTVSATSISKNNKKVKKTGVESSRIENNNKRPNSIIPDTLGEVLYLILDADRTDAREIKSMYVGVFLDRLRNDVKPSIWFKLWEFFQQDLKNYCYLCGIEDANEKVAYLKKNGCMPKYLEGTATDTQIGMINDADKFVLDSYKYVSDDVAKELGWQTAWVFNPRFNWESGNYSETETRHWDRKYKVIRPSTFAEYFNALQV